MNKMLNKSFFIILRYNFDLQPNTLFTLQLSIWADLFSAISANKLLLKQATCGINKG